MIRAAAGLDNIYHAEDLHNEFGEVFDGIGALYQCGSRLCPSYMKVIRKRARERVRVAMRRVSPKGGEMWRLVTLTMPTLPGVNLSTALDLMSDAWRLFSNRRAWWKSVVRAAIKGEEFTLGDEKRISGEGREWQLEQDGYHPHIHILALASWIEWRKLGEEWTACLMIAAAERGIALQIKTEHGRAIVDVRLVLDRKSKSRAISTDGAVEEVCKYITKAESWLKIPDAQLCDVTRTLRGRRMVELLGACRAEKTEAEREAARRAREARRLAVESEEQRRLALEQSRRSISIDDRLQALRENGEATTEWKRIESGGESVTREVVKCNDFQLEAMARAELKTTGELTGLILARVLARTAYLDTQNTFDGLRGAATARDGPILRPKARAAPLRKVGAVLIERGEREKWLEMLAAHVAEVQSYRRAMLAERFPFAKFSTLDGGRWYGLRAQRPAPIR